MRAYYFADKDRKLRYGDNRDIIVDAETRELLFRSSTLINEMLNICVKLIALRGVK